MKHTGLPLFVRRFLSRGLRIKKSLFISFILSYIAILLIPLVCSAVIFVNTRKGVQQEMLQTNRAILTQLGQVTDNHFENIRTFCLDLSLKETISSILYIRQPFDAEQRYNISEAIRKDLKSSASGLFVSSYFVYFNRGQFVLTPSASYTPELYYKEYMSASRDSFKEWTERMQARHYQEIIDLGDQLLYLQTIPYTGSEAVANIGVMLDKARLLHQIEQIEWVDRGMFFAVSKDGQVILSSREEQAFQKLALGREENGILTGVYDGKTAYASRIPSSAGEWSYYLVMDSRYLNTSQKTLNGMFWLCLLLAAALGLLLAYLFSRRNYQPIQKVVHTLESGQNRARDEGELFFIDASVKRMQHLNSDIQRRLEIQESQVRQNFLSRILRGRVNAGFMDDAALRENHLDFPHSNFQTVLFRVDDCSSFFTGSQGPEEDYPLDSMDYSLVLLLQELLLEKYAGCVCEVNGMIACVVNFPDGEEERVMKTLRGARDFVGKTLFIALTLAAGGVHKSLVGMKNSYDEACIALESAILGNGGNEFFYAPSITLAGYGYSAELEQALAGNLRAGNYREAKELIAEIFHWNFHEARPSFELYRCFLFDVAATFIRVIEGMGPQTGELDLNQIASRIGELGCVEQMREYLIQTAESICALANDGKESHNAALLGRIQKYLWENFADCGLSNDQIAQAMGISPAYLSRFFKQQTGDGLLSTISRIRIEEAKKRLAQKEKQTVTEVSKQVGFDSAATFIRIFKKLEGITPGQYAALHS